MTLSILAVDETDVADLFRQPAAGIGHQLRGLLLHAGPKNPIKSSVTELLAGVAQW